MSSPYLPDEADIAAAERVMQLAFHARDRARFAPRLGEFAANARKLRALRLPYETMPASVFDARIHGASPPPKAPHAPRNPSTSPPRTVDRGDPLDLPFASVTQLGAAYRSGVVTVQEVTRLLLERIERHDASIHSIVTPLEERALRAAAAADEAFASGRDLGPLHGIPYLAKDLLAVPDAPTTWGVSRYAERTIDTTAAVVERLDAAGAILLGKASLGELAMSDVWFRATTRNPWDVGEGSRGSSAGSAAGVAAGFATFAIGSETMGSILSPSERCGVVGLRPTFGRVSRFGAMPLSWSLDKIGPIARTIDDLATVLHAIHGRDDRDPASHDAPFPWPVAGAEVQEVRHLRVGVPSTLIDEPDATTQRFLDLTATLDVAVDPVELPALPIEPVMTLLMVEAATAFDEFVRDGGLDELMSQEAVSWPTQLRAARFVSGVDYLQAQRLQSLIREEMTSLMARIDVLATPTLHLRAMRLGNAAGFPAVVLPLTRAGRPVDSVSLVGRADFEHEPLALAAALESLTGPIEAPPLLP